MRSARVAVVAIVLVGAGCSFPDYSVVDDVGPAVDSTVEDVTVDTADGGVDTADASDAEVLADTGEADATDADATDGDATDGEVGDATVCAPVRKLNFPIGAPIKLTCTSAPLIDIPVTGAGGFAFARANLQLQHAVLPAVSYAWNATVEVGAADADQISFGIGDDVCPGAKVNKVAAGYGHLATGSNHVVLHLLQAASPCVAGTLTLLAGSSIDVWVEDDSPDCQKKSIAVASYYKTAGTTTTFDWPATTPTTILTQKIDTAAADTSLLSFTTVEGTPTLNPNTSCGTESATLTMQTMFDGVVQSTVKLPVPASTGVGHLVLDASKDAKVTAGGHSVQLQVAKSFVAKTSTGGCCGDAMIALVRE